MALHSGLTGSDLHDPKEHSLADEIHQAATLAQLNGLVSDEDLAAVSDNLEQFGTAGADGTVPTSQGDGSIAMETPGGGGYSLDVLASILNGTNVTSAVAHQINWDDTARVGGKDPEDRIGSGGVIELFDGEQARISASAGISGAGDGDEVRIRIVDDAGNTWYETRKRLGGGT